MFVTGVYLLLVVVAFVVGEIVYKRCTPKLDFMSLQYTNILKGVAITAVILCHIGQVNSTRLFAPLGGIGVAIFLICSGYGLNESSKKDVDANGFSGGYWLKRIKTVFIPYWITRIIAIILFGGFVFEKFVLDILCIKPGYSLGWYMRYILVWYIIFWFVSVMKLRGKKKTIFLLCVSVLVFVFASAPAEAQQALSFVVGVLLSEYKGEKKVIDITEKKSIITSAILLLVGIICFVIKQMPTVYNTDIRYVTYIVQFGYIFPWACVIVLIVKQLNGLFSWKMFGFIGSISFELYLVHGYLMGWMGGFKNIPIILVLMIVPSVLLHLLTIKVIARKRKVI